MNMCFSRTNIDLHNHFIKLVNEMKFIFVLVSYYIYYNSNILRIFFLRPIKNVCTPVTQPELFIMSWHLWN